MNSFRRHFIKILILLLCSSLTCGSAFAQNKSLRILLIGNSFSQNASTYLPELTKEGGYELTIGHAEIGGCSLQKHWELAELNRLEPDNPNGKPYKGGNSLRMLLADGKWDVVSMQQFSYLSGDVGTYKPYINYLYDLVKSMQPDAKIVMHQTWAYRSDSKSFGRIASDKRAESEDVMYEKSREAYHTIARELNIPVIPTGDAFWLVGKDSQWRYKKDEKFNFLSATYPALPNQINSLHAGYKWDSDKKLVVDTHHANDAGKYLGGLVWYSFLFNESAKTVKFKPETVSEEFAAQLKREADEAIAGKLLPANN